METQTWKEVQSKVYEPCRWAGLALGSFFLITGVIGVLTIHRTVSDGSPIGIALAQLGAMLWASLGGAAVFVLLRRILFPAYVHHAPASELPGVPNEPILVEGSMAHIRVMNELVEDADGWQFRPNMKNWRDEKRFLYLFGLPFFLFFVGVVSWDFHRDLKLAWPKAILAAATITLMTGGVAMLLLALLLRANYRRLCLLTIPKNAEFLVIDFPEAPTIEQTGDLAEGLQWAFVGDVRRQRLTIPHDKVAAVQLCPWRFIAGRETNTCAVQGLLVLTQSTDGAYLRIPIMVTSDFAGAAEIMRRLADQLHVPFLFGADAEGWRAEKVRARLRPPLKMGGSG